MRIETRAVRIVHLAVVTASMLALPHAAAAQSELHMRGLVDLVGTGNDVDAYLNRTMLQMSNFDALRARLFVEGGTTRTRAFVQALVTDAGNEQFQLYGAYVQHKLFEDREVYLEAGKIPVHLGTWAPRTYSNRNPLVGVPLAYYYRSTLGSMMMPIDLEDLLAERGNGQRGVSYRNPDGSPRGAFYGVAPMMYDACWDYGAYVLGSTHRFDAALGATFGAPSNPAGGADTNSSLALNAKVGWAPLPGVALHVSFARGAYLSDDVADYVPAGTSVDDYAQTLWGGSVAWGFGHTDIIAEAFTSHFETPLRDDGLRTFSYYAEGRYRFSPGWYAALRWDEMRFEEVESAAGPVTWDQNIRRTEAGIGYHLSRELLVKAVAQVNDTGDGFDLDRMLPAVQTSFVF
jgi:hypothetical protein